MRHVVVIVLVTSLSPVTSSSARFHRSARSRRSQAREVGDDRWDPAISDSVFKMDFSILQIWMNSDSFCYFCVELFRGPKIMKIFVWPLCDVYYLRKIWNVDFQHFLNVIKIAQLINKWVSMIFLGLINYPKIMKIVLPLSYHVMNIYKNFELNWNKLIYFIILN